MSESSAGYLLDSAAGPSEPGPKRAARRSARSRRSPATWVLLALTLGVAAGGCGGAKTEAPAAAPTPPPAEVSALTILFVPSAGDETTQAANLAVKNALVKAGYKLVVDKSARHDIAVSPTMTATQEQSFLQVTVNGQEQVKLRVHLTLEVASRGQAVDQISTEFVTPAGAVGEADVLKVVSGFGASPRVARFARDRKKEDANKEAARVAAAEVSKKLGDEKVARAQGEWDAIVGDCRQPKTLASCDSLNAWYARTEPQRIGTDTESYKNAEDYNKHMEARQILDAAAPALKEFAEADLWSHVALSRCSAARSTSDCSSVTEYIRRFPVGSHIEEAKKSLEEGNKKIAAKEEQDRRRAEAEQRAAVRRAPTTTARPPAADETNNDRAAYKACLNTCASRRDTTADAAMVRACQAKCGPDDTVCNGRCQLQQGATTSDRCALDCASKYPGASGM